MRSIAETTIHTPVGNRVAVHRKSSHDNGTVHHGHKMGGWKPKKKLKVAGWREDKTPPLGLGIRVRYEALMQTMGDLGAPTMYMPRMNVQALYLEKMGIEKGILAIYDGPTLWKPTFRGPGRPATTLIDVIIASPCRYHRFR